MEKQFRLGDTVKISGYGKALYEITQYTMKSVIEGGVEQVEHEYSVKPVNGTQVIVAFQEDMIMVKPRGSIDMSTVDTMLDAYNDDMSLYEITNDSEYYARAQETLMILQETQIIY